MHERGREKKNKYLKMCRIFTQVSFICLCKSKLEDFRQNQKQSQKDFKKKKHASHQGKLRLKNKERKHANGQVKKLRNEDLDHAIDQEKSKV